ncbi:MAG: DegT/DnrJ/EryC1/StrS family aminotransferase [Vicinamibacterales bacterium]
MPSFTFIATVHALQWMGLTPVFCDVDPATHTLDPERVEALVTPRTSAILGVHVGAPLPAGGTGTHRAPPPPPARLRRRARVRVRERRPAGRQLR